MAEVAVGKVTGQYLSDLAESLRSANSTDKTYLPSEMPEAIRNSPKLSDRVYDMRNGYKFANSTFSELPNNIANVDWSSVTNMSNMFEYCSNLITIPRLDTSNVTSMRYMFHACSSLTAVPQLDTSNVTSMYCMFYDCSRLTTIPQLDTSRVTDMYGMFWSCSSLTTIPQLDTSNVTSMRYMFNSCYRLSDESLNNILAMCINATKVTHSKTLSYIGITNSTLIAKIPSLSNYNAFTEAGWTIN